MRKKTTPKVASFFIAGLFISSILVSCTKMDHFYKDYIISRTFTGKPDSIWIQPGHNRVQISWLTPKDPAAKDVVVYWNSGADSVKVPIDRTVDTARLIIDNLEETDYSFNAYMKDDVGNRSVVMELNTPVYGDIFQSTVREREANHTAIFPDSTVIIWNALQSDTFYGNEIEYTDNAGNTKTAFAPANAVTTTLKDVNNSKPVSIRTVFLPEPNAVDAFYAEDKTVDLIEGEMHSIQLGAPEWQATEYIDFKLVRVFGADDVPDPKAVDIDMAHTMGASSKHNIFSMDGDGFSAFSGDFQALIDSWLTNNVGILTYVGGDAAAQAIYDGLVETDRTQMVAAFESAKASEGEETRLTLLEEGDIIFLHSVDRDLYVAMKVTSSGELNLDLELKISRP